MGLDKMLKISRRFCGSQLHREEGICIHVAIAYIALNLE